MPRFLRAQRVTSVALLAAILGGCSTNAGTRLQELGEVPAMTKITDPTKAPGYEPVTMPSPTNEPTVHQSPAPSSRISAQSRSATWSR